MDGSWGMKGWGIGKLGLVLVYSISIHNHGRCRLDRLGAPNEYLHELRIGEVLMGIEIRR